MCKCPECKRIYAAKLVRAGESFNNPPMVEDILREERYIKKYNMCSNCYKISKRDGKSNNK